MINSGIGINNIPAPAKMVQPHPYPTAEYISDPNNGKQAPTRDLKSEPAAMALAA